MSRTACLLFHSCPQLRTPLLLLRRAVAGVLRFSAEKAIPRGPFLFFSSPQWRWSSRRQPSPLFTLRPQPLRQWQDSAAGPISSGRLPQDKCESSTSLFYQLIGLFLTWLGVLLSFWAFPLGGDTWCQVLFEYLLDWVSSEQIHGKKKKKQIVQAAMTQNNDLAMFKEGWTISSCPKRLEINRANLKVLAVLLNYHSLFETDNKTAWI